MQNKMYVSVLAAVALALVVFTGQRASTWAYCPAQGESSPDWCSFVVQPPVADADSEGYFTLAQRLDWCTDQELEMGAFASSSWENIEGNAVGFTPAYFFPTSGQSGLWTTLNGQLHELTDDGSFQELGWVWTPYLSDAREVTVNKP